MAKQAVIVKTGRKLDTLAAIPGDYEDWIAAGFAQDRSALLVIDVAEGETLPPLHGVSAIAITGSGAMVTEYAQWMARTAVWLREAIAADIPILGICFGHQLLAEALGGKVGYNPRGVEVGTTTISLTDAARNDPLFGRLPGQFPAQVTHRQSVLRLPEGARRLAASDKDPHQAFAYGSCAWGVQFHPEFSDRIIRHFIEYYRERLAGEGDSAERLLARTAPSPDSASLLRKFARLAKACSEAQ